MVVLKPNIVRGGRAIGLGNNFYLMKGRTHSKGGIDVGKNPKTGLEVENNEVMQVSPKGIRVFSAQPILGGISPAQYILGGANPNQVFNAQEQWKKINKVNDDGTKKAKYGKEEIVAKRYNSAYNALIKNGYTDKDAERLVPFIISQSILESGYVNKDDNNYGGYLKNGKRIKYNSEEEFYTSHINNLKNKWPTISNAKNIDDYLRIIHGGDIKEGNVWDYAPKEKNDNYDNRVKSVYNKINNYINIYRKNYKNRDFITKLDPIEEQEFQKWYKSQAVVNGISLNPDDKEHYYDYRGFWKENRGKSNIGHFTDKYKIPGHPTFSEESVYSQPIVKGGKWNYINTPVKEEKFVPSNFNLNYKYGGRIIARNGTQRSRKKMFSDVTKQIKQIAKQEENRNTPLPIRGEKPITPLGYNIASYAPIVGDAIQLGEGISDIKNRNYLAGAINLGLLALPNVIQGPVKKGIQSAVRKYEIKHLPGYQLKSLMEGNPLEKQLSKDGTISVNSIKAISNKGSEVEKSVIDKVLDTKYFGKKSIDYNDFRKSIQDELITYNRTPDTRYSDYGIDRLFPDPAGRSAGWYGIATPQTFTFSSPRIPNGSGKHYDANTLGHSRTYTTIYEPDVLHVMESQSDWGQHKLNKSIGEEQAREGYEYAKKRINDTKEALDTGIDIHSEEQLSEEDIKWYKDELVKAESRLKLWGNKLSEIRKKTAQENYLHDNFTSRQIQENLKYAAEQGQSKMRYPTRETAAKIEGYSKSRSQTLQDNPELQKHYDELRATLKAEEDRIVKKYAPKDYLDESMREADFGDMGFSEEETKRLIDQIRKSEEFEKSAKGAKMREEIIRAREKINPDKWLIENVPETYIPQHETILRKYDVFPKQYKKLFKDANVRTITDKIGNSWYEVDVPKNYLNQEWQYKYGGIHIKPSKRGTFTAAAKKHGMSVQGFASKVLANKGKYSSAMVKKANFARNASKWKHKEFGGDMDFNYWITKDNIYKLGGRKKGQWGLQDYSNSFKVNLQPFVPTTVQGTKTNVNNALSLGIPNIITGGLNLAGNVASYFVNRRALKSMQAPVAPSAPTPLRAENLETRVSTAAQEAALRENIAKQENLIAGNLSSSRSRLNAVNQIRNQGIGLYNQLQERKQNVQTELINRAKLNRQQINNQNTLLANQYKDKVTNWRNSVIDFENKRRDALSENTIQHLIQGPIDAIAGEKGYFANLENNKRYRITAFLNAIGNPYAHKAVTSGEFLPLAKQFGLTENDLKRLGLM